MEIYLQRPLTQLSAIQLNQFSWNFINILFSANVCCLPTIFINALSKLADEENETLGLYHFCE